VSLDVPSHAPALQGLTEEIGSALGDAVLELVENHGQLILRVSRDDRLRALAVLKTLGFDLYSFACGVDWPEQDKIEVFDHVFSTATKVRVTVKCDLPRSDPRVKTAIDIYAGADWHERETWELFGVVFEGHPRLRRLLLPDWQEGFPMRKDETLRARVEKPWPGEFFEA
jgi:NADH-quinone oxidoreductase subunit C